MRESVHGPCPHTKGRSLWRGQPGVWISSVEEMSHHVYRILRRDFHADATEIQAAAVVTITVFHF